MEELVVIRRVYRNKRLGEVTLENSHMSFGCAVKGRGMAMPVSANDEKGMKLYADICNLTPKQAGFRENVNDFLHSIRIQVPHDGLPLNIATTKDGYPINPTEYLYYQIALSNIKEQTGVVHKTEQEALRHPKGMFYIENLKEIKKDKAKALDDQADALVAMKNIFTERKDKVDWILSYFGMNPYAMKDIEDKKIAMSTIIEGKAINNPIVTIAGLGKVQYKNRPAKVFTAICKNKDIEYRAIIELLQRNGIITDVGGKYFFEEIELGLGMDDVVARISKTDADSKKLLLQIKARYEELKSTMKG